MQGRNSPRRARGGHDHQTDGLRPDEPARGRRGTAGFLISLGLTVASTALPGSGLLGAHRRWLRWAGRVLMAVIVAGVVAVAGWVRAEPSKATRLLASVDVLRGAWPVIVVVACLWVVVIAATQLATRPHDLPAGQRLIGAGVVGLLSFTVAAPSALAALYTHNAYVLLTSVVKDADEVKASSRPTLPTNPVKDPWEGIDRVNILLLGADTSQARMDENADRQVLTDTIMVASIDTHTGDTTLVQIPRNVQHTPFPAGSEMAAAFPNGFRGKGDPGEWFVNAIWGRVEQDFPNLMQGNTYRGAEALKLGVEGITGLKIDYFVMLNLDGAQQLVDAMGGITVNINPVKDDPRGLAIGGSHSPRQAPSGYLAPGPNQHLDGYHALWFARSRYNTDDYDRMRRQSCFIKAVIDQANPATLLTRFEAIADASAGMLVTDIPSQALDPIVDLALRVQDGQITRLAFVNGQNYDYANPDFDSMRAQVADAITPKDTTGSQTGTPTGTATPDATTSPADSPKTTTPGNSQNVADTCAYTGP